MIDPGNSHSQPGNLRLILLSPLLHLQILLVLAVLLGGGGVAYGFRNLTIALFAMLLLALHGTLLARFWREAGWGLRLLLLATLALPLIQLIPLPPTMWQGLPGREPVLASHRVAGWGDEQWFPLSMDRARTLVAFCGLIVPATMIMLGARLPDQHKRVLVWTLLVLTLLSLLWGLVQLQSGNEFGLLTPITPQPDVLYATFGNRNSTGLLFVCATALALGLVQGQQPRTMLALLVLSALLIVGTILTQSRSSMALLAAPLVLALLRLGWAAIKRSRSPVRDSKLLVAAMACMVLLVTGAIAYSATQPGGRVAAAFARFSDAGTDRPEMWEDGIYAAQQYWPLGSGMGTFDEVFQLHESLEYVSPRRAGRAHSDWIEVAIEAGPFGLALALGWVLWVAAACWRQWWRGPYWPALGAGVASGAVALQSLLDYPLRNQTLLCLAGLLVAVLAAKRKREQNP